ncbi:hypothetical protein OAT45_04690 [Alphaproteobacteria bacterium]|nr:hypothetical protein [Alphaproteobacteria bacterium]
MRSLPSLGMLKAWLAIACWGISLPLLLMPSPAPTAAMNFAGLLFLLFLGVAFLRLSKQSYIIVAALFFIGGLVLPDWPDWEQIKQAGSFVLIFACLMPTLTLVRATAMTMPSVSRTQDKLAALPPKYSASGLQLASQILGGVMNIGTFALVSAALPAEASEERRKLAAEAALRGMNVAVLWSPFFIAFAVAGIYLPAGFAPGAISLGVLLAILFFIISSAIAAPSGARFAIWQSLQPLAPVASRLFFAAVCVILLSFATGLTALYAIIATMPLLCALQMVRRRETAKTILTNFMALQKNSGDDLVIISLSMVIASLASQTDYLSAILTAIFGSAPDIQIMLFALPVIVWIGAFIGVHPVISSAPLLAFFSPGVSVYDAMFLAQAHMLGWCTGTMTSYASLSVVTVSQQFRLRAGQLSFGVNFMASGALAIGGGILLGLLNHLFAAFFI